MEDAKTPDKFADIIEYCHYSSSQDEILTHSNFAGEIEVVSGDGKKSTVEGNSGGSHKKSKGGDEIKEKESGEFVAICADCEERENLGFRKRSLIDGGFDGKVKLDERIKVGSARFGEKGRESPLKKTRVSSNSEEIETGRVVFRSDSKVKVVSPMNFVVLESGQCSKKSVSESGNEERVKACVENLDKKKLQLEDGEGNGAKNRENDHVIYCVEKESCDKNREGELNESDKGKEGVSHGSKMPGKRELPRSLLGQVWGTTLEGDDRVRNGIDGTTTRKDGSDEAKADVTEKEKSKDDRTIRNLFDVLRILAVESRYGESVEIDIFETAKRRGMTFPRSRFRKDMN